MTSAVGRVWIESTKGRPHASAGVGAAGGAAGAPWIESTGWSMGTGGLDQLDADPAARSEGEDGLVLELQKFT